MEWLDAARGIGIVLVVYAHGARALPNVLPQSGLFQLVDELIYSFHMPLFFFLAGLVSRGSLVRSRQEFFAKRLVTVAYPYFLWSLVYWALEIVFRDRVNTPLDPSSILWILWSPIEHLWFLYVLFLCQVLAVVMWPRMAMLALLAAWSLLGPLPDITVPQLWTQLPWFVVGLMLAPLCTQAREGGARELPFALGLAATGIIGLVISSAIILPDRIAVFLAAGAGIGVTVALATVLRTSRVITYLGEASLSIYLMHTIFSAGAREFLEEFYPVGGVGLLVITVSAGLAGPLVIHEVAKRAGVAPYLGLGKMVPASPGNGGGK